MTIINLPALTSETAIGNLWGQSGKDLSLFGRWSELYRCVEWNAPIARVTHSSWYYPLSTTTSTSGFWEHLTYHTISGSCHHCSLRRMENLVNPEIIILSIISCVSHDIMLFENYLNIFPAPPVLRPRLILETCIFSQWNLLWIIELPLESRETLLCIYTQTTHDYMLISVAMLFKRHHYAYNTQPMITCSLYWQCYSRNTLLDIIAYNHTIHDYMLVLLAMLFERHYYAYNTQPMITCSSYWQCYSRNTLLDIIAYNHTIHDYMLVVTLKRFLIRHNCI